jgi:hypothetical protein
MARERTLHAMRMGEDLPPEEPRALTESPSPGLGLRALRAVGFAQDLRCLGVEPAKRLRLNSIGQGADEKLSACVTSQITTPQ